MPGTASIEPNVRKIAVLRANALGDLMFALPALTALRSTYSHAEIVLLGRPWHHTFLTGRPGPIDRVVVIPDGGLGTEGAQPQDPVALAQFFQAMVQERFDIAVQLHGGGRNSNPFTLQLGARLTVGSRTPDAVPLDRWVPYLYYQPEIWRYLEVVALIGATTPQHSPQLTVTPADLEAARASMSLADGSPLVALHPGATDPRRRWATANFAVVGDALAAAGVRVVLTGTAPEQAIVAAVAEAMTATVQNVCGSLSLSGLAGLLSRCQLVISNDSGPLHLAAAVGAPTIGIFWCGNLITAGLPTRTWHRPMISWRLDCPVCETNCTTDTCDHTASFVDEVKTESVIAAALDLLALQSMR